MTWRPFCVTAPIKPLDLSPSHLQCVGFAFSVLNVLRWFFWRGDWAIKPLSCRPRHDAGPVHSRPKKHLPCQGCALTPLQNPQGFCFPAARSVTQFPAPASRISTCCRSSMCYKQKSRCSRTDFSLQDKYFLSFVNFLLDFRQDKGQRRSPSALCQCVVCERYDQRPLGPK